MKLRKYVIFIALLLIVTGYNKVYAADCLYVGDGVSARYVIRNKVYIDRAGSSLDDGNYEDILNFGYSSKVNDWTIPAYTNLNACPKYLILEYDTCVCCLFCAIEAYYVYATDNEIEATQARTDIGKQNKVYGYIARRQDGMTTDEYERQTIEGIFQADYDDGDDAGDVNCDSIFGDKDDAGGINPDGTKRPASLRYIVNDVLSYVRIIVPILIILLGSLDLAKAVTAGKEDEMKKAQKTFIMRLIAGLLVFLAPIIVDIVMWLADIVWQGLGYTTDCNI